MLRGCSSNGAHTIKQSDGIIEEEANIGEIGEGDSLLSVDQLKECMSETSLKFLSQHSVQLIEEKHEMQECVNKLELLEIYE